MKVVKLLLLSSAMMLPICSVRAQNAVQTELMQLREDIQVLQRKLYREQQDGITPASAQDVAVKLGQFDESLRQAVGKIDEMEFKLKSLNETMKKGEGKKKNSSERNKRLEKTPSLRTVSPLL